MALSQIRIARILPLVLFFALAAGARAAVILEAEASQPSLSLEAQDEAQDMGRGGAGTADYDQVELAGEVVQPGEDQPDGWIQGFKNGRIFGQVGSVVELRMRPGQAAKEGEDYVVFRNDGELVAPNGGRSVGVLLRTVGVLRVTSVDGARVSGRVLKQYANLLKDDGIRLREPQREKYYALLKRRRVPPRKDLKGQVVGVLPPNLFAVKGDIVYLDLGLKQGLRPGMRLDVIDDLNPEAMEPDDDDSKMPLHPMADVEPPSDDIGGLEPTGDIATVEVVNATDSACAARVIRCEDDVRLGEHVITP
ncbi:MAG TPA: hypothetical protein VK914_11440 [bacterium]|jgi:hypothetical protein|nr:hypothetical protein [bacterium]